MTTNIVGAEFEIGGLTLALLDSAALGIEVRANNYPTALPGIAVTRQRPCAAAHHAA